MRSLTKTTYLLGRHCPKRFWLRSNGVPEPTLTPEELQGDRELQGAAVESLAELLFPSAVRIGASEDEDETVEMRTTTTESITRTRVELESGRTVVQAHVSAGDLLAIIDVVEARNGGWFLWEVKSSTYDETERKVKAIHDWDLAFQVHVARAAGLDVVGAGLLLLRKAYARGGDGIDPEGLIVRVDRSAAIDAKQAEVACEVKGLLELRGSRVEPEAPPGPWCTKGRGSVDGRHPSECGHIATDGRCGSELPVDWIGRLPRLSRNKGAMDLIRTNPLRTIDTIEIDSGNVRWTDAQRRVIQCHQDGQPWTDPKALASALAYIEWPVAYLDFEFDTGHAIPPYPGSRPYDGLPFQWALTIQEEPDGSLGPTQSFLHLDTSDPRRPFAESLLDALPGSGSIVVHHRAAETTILRVLAARLGPPVAAALESAIERLEDTEKIASAGYLHPSQIGSYSLKTLAPALVGQGYGDLAIGNGLIAVSRWRRAIASDCGRAERDQLREQLEAYCGRDAELMHGILEALRGIVREANA